MAERLFDGAIFDMDGTLLDSMGVWAEVDRAFLARRGIPLTRDYVEALAAMSFAEAADYTIARYGLNEKKDDIYAEWDDLARDAYAHHVLLKPGAGDYLRRLKAQGIKIALATAATAAYYEPALGRNGVLSLFDAFCTTQEAGEGKHSPAVFFLAAKKLGISPDRCAVFEDVLQGINSAKSAGMLAYGIYDASSAALEGAMRAAADGYFCAFGPVMPGDPDYLPGKNA